MRDPLHRAAARLPRMASQQCCADGGAKGPVPSVVSMTTRSPLGEPERPPGGGCRGCGSAPCSCLPPRGCAALAVGAVGGHLAIGSLALLRDLAGLAGVGLLTAAILGASLSWTGPLAYLVFAIYPVQEGWTTPRLWPARPGRDPGAAICVAVIFAVGVSVIALRGARESDRD